MLTALLSLLMLLNPPAPADAGADVAALLDGFHAAAARADETAYFACLAENAVFMGTDATERWTAAELRAYAHPLFSQGKGWTYVPEKRSVALSPHGQVAWFDELLKNEKYGACRGTGVALLAGDGWRIAHYSLTFLVPNERARDVVAAIARASGKEEHDRAVADEHAHGAHAHGDDATVRHRFDDVEHWVEVFDDPARDEWQKPREVVKALGVKAGDVVADIGAGTGYFTPHLARAAGDAGTVFAVEVEPAMVEHLRKRAETETLARVVPVLGSFDDPRLPRGAVDLVLIVNTYHHIDARIDYFSRLRASLAKGGRLALVEFNDKPRPVGPPPEHALSKEKIVAELKEAGWALEADQAILPWQYVLVFR